MKHEPSQIMSQAIAPVYVEMPSTLQAIHENGELSGVPFVFQRTSWNSKPVEKIRDRLLAVSNKGDAAAFLTFAGYVVMMNTGITATTPVYPIKPEQVSDSLLDYIREWQQACREILTKTYRYPAKQALRFERATVLDLARRGTGRFNEIPVTFTWDNLGKPKLTLRPQTRLEAAVLHCHLAKLAGWKFRRCPVCETVFEVTDPRKKFCTYECAHLAVVRRGRKRARKRKGRT